MLLYDYYYDIHTSSHIFDLYPDISGFGMSFPFLHFFFMALFLQSLQCCRLCGASCTRSTRNRHKFRVKPLFGTFRDLNGVFSPFMIFTRDNATIRIASNEIQDFLFYVIIGKVEINLEQIKLKYKMVYTLFPL